jgi:hypothetical protein
MWLNWFGVNFQTIHNVNSFIDSVIGEDANSVFFLLLENMRKAPQQQQRKSLRNWPLTVFIYFSNRLNAVMILNWQVFFLHQSFLVLSCSLHSFITIIRTFQWNTTNSFIRLVINLVFFWMISLNYWNFVERKIQKHWKCVRQLWRQCMREEFTIILVIYVLHCVFLCCFPTSSFFNWILYLLIRRRISSLLSNSWLARSTVRFISCFLFIVLAHLNPKQLSLTSTTHFMYWHISSVLKKCYTIKHNWQCLI